MKTRTRTILRILLAGLLAGLVLWLPEAVAQTTQNYSVYLWDWTGRQWFYPKLGTGFAVIPPATGERYGRVDVLFPPPPAIPQRETDRELTWEAAAGGYRLPLATATHVVVYVNGLRYRQGLDYSVSGGLVVPRPGATNWPPPEDGPVVVADYDH